MGPKSSRLALESAAHGLVSGTLSEWPVLAAALREAGHPLPLTARASEIKAAALAALGEEQTMGRRATDHQSNCCEHCDQVGDVRVDVAALKGLVEAATGSLSRIEKQMVTRAEFNPVRALVFGLVGLVMTAFVMNLLK